MVFSSIVFLFIYLTAVLALYTVTPLRWRNGVLLVANLIFYGWGEPKLIILMVVSTLVNYICGFLIEKYRDKPRFAKGCLIASVVISLGLLGFFKYTDFAIENLRLLPFLSFLQPLRVTLPIGISFYTFQTMSYTIDVYRGEVPAQKSIVKFGTYVSFFAQLIAGPIVRYKDVAAQLDKRPRSVGQFASGVQRFVIGLGKKVLLANTIGQLYDAVSALPAAELTTAGAWMGMLAFSFQIYFDFSGYSDMAIGLGRMFGFEFLENFRYPYVSRSVTDFWRRWHISLGTWFREYVYIPLGGNRRGAWKQIRNILIVWGLTGIWHGASWNFLLWGLYYAVLLIAEKLFLLKALEKAPRPVGHAYTLLTVVFGWTLFVNTSLGECGRFLAAMCGFAPGGFGCAADGYRLRNYAVLLVILLIACTPLAKKLFDKLPQTVQAVAQPLLVAGGMLLSVAYLVNATYNPFLYFRF
ncbi:MAG: MBOAT family protein [Clostridia bacterium]|nr:MBOAT family protein [Clostridia bacterium]